MIGKLDKYYRNSGIHPLVFNCKHYAECKSKSANFTEAKSSFVGSEYAKATLPRLLILSLDAFDSPTDPRKRTLNAVRKIVERKGPPEKKNNHWYRTHETGWLLLNRLYRYKFNSELNLEDVTPYFAHVNSAKCCSHRINHKQADRKLFQNCREYIPAEVELLEPDIIVTQGKLARKAIEDKFEIVKRQNSDINSYPCSYEILRINWKNVYVFHTFHPSNYSQFHNQKNKCFEKFANLIYKEFTK